MLEADAKIDLTRGRVRPYVTSGLGLYHSVDVTEQNFLCGPGGASGAYDCRQTAGRETKYRDVRVGVGLHAGLGVTAVLGRTHVFAELRSLSLSDAQNRMWRTPLMLGMRF